jgi:hypothetical protein
MESCLVTGQDKWGALMGSGDGQLMGWKEFWPVFGDLKFPSDHVRISGVIWGKSSSHYFCLNNGVNVL